MATKNTDKKSAPKKSAQEEILALARERFIQAESAESEIRKLALEDIQFSIGEQWPEKLKQDRAIEARPCLTINRLPQVIHQVTNDQRQNRPAIKVSPVDDKADKETAKIMQGLTRNIEYSSDADTAYDIAFDSAVRGGFGFFRVVTDYCDPFSFDQEIRILSVSNRFTCYLDPNYQKPDGSDATWGTSFESLTEEAYKSQYPNSELSKMTDWESLGDRSDGFIQKNQCRVAEYFTKTYKDVSLVQLSDGQVFTSEKLDEILKDSPQLLEGLKVVGKRKTVEPAIKWYKHNGIEILEERDWPGKWIPIIPVLGDQIFIDGRRVLEGIVRHAKDPQRMYNYWATSETETIALAPKAPFIGAEGQFEGHEAKWNTANTRNHPYLEYKPTLLDNGQVAPPPTRNAYEPPVQAISHARMLASEDLKATTGIYDAALGNRSNENSGVAIQRRNVQAQTSNFHFIDNLSKSIRHCGRIIVDLIPHIYDAPRAIRILGEDGEEEIVRINEIFEKNGKKTHYQMNVGKYDVTVSTGPSYQTKRQEAADAMLELATKVPQLMQVAPDLVVRSLDIPDAEVLSERLKKTLPPGMVEEKDKQPVPPEAQQQLSQQSQMIEALTEQLKSKTEIINNKTIELESKERIEFAKIQSNVEIELAKLGSTESLELLTLEVKQIENRLNLLGINEPFPSENEPEVGGLNPAAPTDQMNQQPPTGGLPPGPSMGV